MRCNLLLLKLLLVLPTLFIFQPTLMSQGQIPQIKKQPVDASICAGKDHTFEVSATGDNLAYQWYKGNNPVLGANQYKLTIKNATQIDYDMYYVVIKNDVGTTFSDKVKLWVAEPLPESMMITQYPNPAITGQKYTVEVEGHIDVTKYSWSFSLPGAVFSAISGQKTASEVTFGSSSIGTGTLSAVLEHVCGNKTITQDITVQWPTGLDDIADNNVWVGPNPARGQLTIDNGRLAIDNVIVTDLSGKVIFRTSSALGSQLSIDCSGWIPGIYLVKVTSETKNFKVFKIIKK